MPSTVDLKRLFTFPEVSGRRLGLRRRKPGGQVLLKRSQIASRRWPRVYVAKVAAELEAEKKQVAQEAVAQQARAPQQAQKDYDFYSTSDLNQEVLQRVNKNISNFGDLVKPYRKILFVCGDYPGYGGAATNCNALHMHFRSRGHETYAYYFNFEKGANAKHEWGKERAIGDLTEIKRVTFKPDLIILKSPCAYALKEAFKCPVYYLIGGIYSNNLGKYFYDIRGKREQDRYINRGVLSQIRRSTLSFTNSSHTREILEKHYKLDTRLFYSSFIPFINQTPLVDEGFDKRKYNYGLIVSNFATREIKNVRKSIGFLKGKDKVILIGKNSRKYEHLGFECVDLVGKNQLENYYKQIKYIVQDSFYESCSNVKIEGIYNGCKIMSDKTTFGILLMQQFSGNFFEQYITFINKKLLSLNITASIFIYSSSKVKKNPINCNLNIEYVNDRNIYYIMGNKYKLSTLLILYLPLQMIDDFSNFDQLMNKTSIKKYLFLGGIVNHMYHYIEKYNINNTIGYGNGYKLLYSKINHYNLKEYVFPYFNGVVKSKNALNKSFIHIGRLSLEKNQTFLINGFYRFLKEINDYSYKLYIVYRNNNDIEKYIINFIKNNQLEKNIILLGWMKQEDLFSFCIDNIDHNILTSTNEGLSGITLEMMKLGIPTISSNICCINEIITNNENGLLFEYVDYMNLLIKNKKNSKNLATDINKHFDTNLKHFIETLKKTVDDLPLFNKLSSCCLRFHKEFYKKDNYSIFITNKKQVQLYIGEHLRKGFEKSLFKTQTINKYSFIDFHDYNSPCIFYGIYGDNDINTLNQMKNTSIIIWTGGDINIVNRPPVVENRILNNVNIIKEKSKKYNIIHIATQKFLAESISSIGFEYKIYPFMGLEFNNFTPCIYERNIIYVYVGNWTEYYGISLILQVYEKLKHKYEFIFTSSYSDKNILNVASVSLKIPIIHVHKHNIKQLYMKTFIGLRFTIHDSLSATVQELGCMGIKSICNSIDSPSCYAYTDLDSIINIIDNEYINRNNINKIIRTSNETINYLKIGDELIDRLLY